MYQLVVCKNTTNVLGHSIADNIFKWVIKRFQAAVKTSRTAKESIEESQPFTRLRAGNTKRKMSSHVARNYGSFAPGPTVTQDPLTPIESDSGCPDTFEEDDFDFVLFYEPDPQPSSNFRAPEAEMISRTHQVGNSSEITTSESHPDEAGPSMQTRSKRTRAAGAGDDDLEIIKHLKHRRMDTTDTHENLVPPAIDDARINSTSTGPLNLNPVRTSLPCRLSERVGSIDGLPRSPRINPINPESGESTNQMETENSNIGNGNGSLRAPGLDSGVVGRPCLQPAAPTETHADATGERSVDEENRQSTFSESAGTESTLEHDRLLLRSKLLNDMSPTEGQSDPANEALELVKGTLEKYKEQLTTTAGIDYRTDREKLTELMDSNEAARQFRTKIHYRGTYEDWRTEANAPGNHARFHELVRCLSEAQISWRSAHPDLRLSQLKIEVGRMLYAVADFGALGLGVQFVTDQIVELLSGDTQDWLEGPRKRNEHGCEEVM